ELVAGKTLTGRYRLLPAPALRCLTEMALRDLEVPAEYACITQLQARDLRLFAQARLELHDEALTVLRQRSQPVELRVESVTECAALVRSNGRIVDERAREHIVEVLASIDEGRLLHSSRRNRQLERVARRRIGTHGESVIDVRELGQRSLQKR